MFFICVPILFEIVDQISGDWVDAAGKLTIGVGKFITILIGIAYLGSAIYFACKEKNDLALLEEKESKIKELEKQCEAYKNSMKSTCNVVGYTTEKIKQQIGEYRKTQHIDMRYMNMTNAATIVCECLYSNIEDLTSKGTEVTVNYYRRFHENKRVYTEMIAHEGYNTNPKYYRIRKLLKQDKDMYFCEKLLYDDNPDVIFLKDKKEILKAFKMNKEECKYNQYIGLPIRRMGSGEKVALIEIVVHNNSIVWNTQDEARGFITKFCDTFKEYILLIDMLSMLYETVNEYNSLAQRSENYGKNSEV